MLDKLEAIKARFDQVGVALTNPEIINNQSEFGKFSKEYRSLEKIVIPYERYVKVLAEHKFAKDALNGDDADMRELAKKCRDAHPASLVTYSWIPRDENSHADPLANKALDGGQANEPTVVVQEN